jgi:uncharacterized protein (TIGR00299 family) protein
LKIGYFDCFAGASGDMIMAALFDVGLRETDLAESLSKLGIKPVELSIKDVMRKGIRAKSFSFAFGGKSERRAFKEIADLIASSDLSQWVKEKSLTAFRLIADAESRIHGVAPDDVHFHEVGALDSIVDVVGAFSAIRCLGLGRMFASPLALGSGYVDCEHGRIPVPAPATLEIARGIPVRSWQVSGELTTPTGAAILRTCASEFGPIPRMTVAEIGYGAGSRDIKQIPNVMRLVVGESADYDLDRVTQIETNIDDMNPEFFTHIYNDVLSLGALDVWVEHIMMKKGRPGFLLRVLTDRQFVPAISEYILAETTTAGLRLLEVDRWKLPREIVEITTKFGTVAAKVFDLGLRKRCAPEYEDCVRLAKSAGTSVSEVIEEAKNEFRRVSEKSS